MSQPLPFPGVLLLTNPRKSGSTKNPHPESLLLPGSPAFQQECEQPSRQLDWVPSRMALTGLLKKCLLVTLYNMGDMAVTIEMQNTGDSRARREILAGVEHVLGDLAGEWRVSIIGSRANDDWEMKVEGSRGFERSYTLVGEAGEHQPEAIRSVLIKLLPATTR